MSQADPRHTVDAPAHVLVSSAPASRLRWLWATLSLLATVAIVIELVWASHRTLLAQPEVRQLLEPIAERAGYQVIIPVLDDAWSVGKLTISANKDHPGVWQFDAMLSQQARIFQPWPALELTLRDWQGQLIGRQRLTHRDYLPATTEAKGLAPKQRIRIQIAVDLREETQRFEQASLVVVP